MIYPNKNEFIKLAQKGNVIPVYTEIPADLETPVSAFLKIETKDSFLLESVEKGRNIARYSFIGSSPFLKYKSTDKDPYQELREILKKYRPVKIDNLPDFHGGAVGYFSYDSVRFIEELPDSNQDDLQIPYAQFMLTNTILAFDHVKNTIFIISNAYIDGSVDQAYADALKNIEIIIEKLKKPLAVSKGQMLTFNSKKNKFKSNFEQKEFETIVKKAQKYIKDGDIMQVVLSQRFDKEFTGDPFELYRKLRMLNPSPYMFYLKFDEMQVIGSSPEILVKYTDDIAIVRPIAGTRKRGKNKAEDDALAQELLADEKERAEHLMLLDLGRNDLGRVCDYESVKVTDQYYLEKYSHVMHIVSNIEGKLKKSVDRFDLIKAAFPAGTVSGAPKVRAMEIIDELETRRRGLYAGAIGYFDFYGNLDFCIAIRTMIVKNNKAYMQAGAGIVADSDPASEYQETISKAGAVFKIFDL